MKPVIILQARTGSTRLPNKMVINFYHGKSILDILLERLKEHFGRITDIILATTLNKSDDVLVKIAQKNNVPCFRGSEEDVLQRFIDTAILYKATSIIRICADNPFLSMNYLQQLYSYVLNNNSEYVSFISSDKTPSIKTHYGFWAEYATLEALKKIVGKTDDIYYHEHVTNFIYSNPKEFRIDFIPIEKFIEDKTLRLTVDTHEDFIICQQLFNKLMHEHKEIEPCNILPLIDADLLNKMNEMINKNIK